MARILLIDSYDSFTFNLASLCRQSIPDCEVHIIKNDDLTISELTPYLASFSAVIVGPGPGSPEDSHDIGVVRDLWKLPQELAIPIFGVCLGLQSLAIEFGAQLKRLPVVKHGQVSRINHRGSSIFEGVGQIDAVRYHSLHVQLPSASEIEELAWADDGLENGKVVMGIRHKTHPFYAVQYHPESALTVGGGKDVLENFWRLAESWNAGRVIIPLTPQRSAGSAAFIANLWKLFTIWKTDAPSKPPIFSQWPPSPDFGAFIPPTISVSVKSTVINLPSLAVTEICELLKVHDEASSFVLLDSAANPGRYSIIGALHASSTHISFNVRDKFVQLRTNNQTRVESLEGNDIWSWVASFMRPRKAVNGPPEIPFWGGLVGYLSYELGVESLHVHQYDRSAPKTHPDLNLVFVDRSVVVDTVTGDLYIQSTLPNDHVWIADTCRLLEGAARCPGNRDCSASCSAADVPPTITFPDQDLYKSRIDMAKERLFSGDSYELCLTAPTRISVPKSTKAGESSSWNRYKKLRKNNPAPHSAYIRLHPTTFLSSSPERFLSFSRSPDPVFQLRPIKGTVRKAPGITRAVAEELLIGSPKEVAENLMIVDLIRHDLHGVLGEDVAVKQFCGVEEYQTVWQLVSVIEGKLPPSLYQPEDVGWDVLKKCLPPGSMTGAPKKRSVEILQTLEDSNRSIYSGVFGYWCISGRGDWSVTIRSCFKFDDGSESEQEEWVIGAGGAITALSDPDAEWDEMMVKLQSVLRTFEP